jgi:2-polyprenyl-6-methoxyphenol hydroxylase-like FAD-dependent oxidoreductase
MKVLISGIGVAGPTLAYWLAEQGIEVTLVEQAPRLRRGGYVVDFWGLGFDVAERMSRLSDLQKKGYRVQEVRMVDGRGRRVGGFSAKDVFGRLTLGRYLSVPRGELAASLYESIEDRAETIFGDSLVALEQDDREVRVSFARSGVRAFDLVIGADGLHSNVRRLAFGEESRYEKYLGYKVAAFETEGYRPRNPDVYLLHTEVGQQVGRFSMRDDRTMFLFVFSDQDPERAMGAGADGQKAELRRRFGHSGWECPQILQALDSVTELYFDRVSQIQMPSWSRGRVSLVGDAAFCVSLLGGQGSALAMTAAYVLASELKAAAGNHRTAFERYHQRLASFIDRKQKAAARFAGFFAPRSRLRLFLHNQVTRLLSLPFVADVAFRRDLTDRISLPPR